MSKNNNRCKDFELDLMIFESNHCSVEDLEYLITEYFGDDCLRTEAFNIVNFELRCYTFKEYEIGVKVDLRDKSIIEYTYKLYENSHF